MIQKIHYTIYQIPSPEMPHDYFQGEQEKLMTPTNISKYRCVYEGSLMGDPSSNILNILEDIFERSHQQHLDESTGRGLSCGDVVGIMINSKMHYYLCSFSGWSNISNVFSHHASNCALNKTLS